MKYELREIDSIRNNDEYSCGWEWNTSYLIDEYETEGDEKRAFSECIT